MDTWNLIAVIVLALLLLLILPMTAARHGVHSLTEALNLPLHRTKKRGALGLVLNENKPKPERHVNNSGQGELTVIVSKLITFSQRQHYTPVYPGTVTVDGQTATTLALMVTPGGVVGLNCFGFAGSIRPGTAPGKAWTQHINGKDVTLTDPVEASRKQQALLRRAMDKAGLGGIPVEVIPVFTSPEARLEGEAAALCYTRDGMLDYLSLPKFRSGPVEDTHAVGVKLKNLVTMTGTASRSQRRR